MSRFLAEYSKLPDFQNCQSIAKQLTAKGIYEESKAILAYQVGQNKIVAKNFNDSIYSKEVATIATMKKYRGEGMTQLWLTNWILQLSRFFAVKGGIEENQLEVAAELIIEDFFYFTIADFTLFGKKAIKGEFGTTYNRFDVPTLLEWLNKYRGQRFQYAMQQNAKNQRQIERAEKAIPMPEYIREFIGELKPKEPKVKPTFENLFNDELIKKQWKKNFDSEKPKTDFKTYCQLQYHKLIKT